MHRELLFFPDDGLHQLSHTYRIEVYRSAMIRALILQRRTSNLSQDKLRVKSDLAPPEC